LSGNSCKIIVNCKIANADNTGKCTECSDYIGFYLTAEGKCTARTHKLCNNQIPVTATTYFNTDSDTCSNCGYGYKLSDANLCVKTTDHCLRWTGTKCTLCDFTEGATGFGLRNGVCIENSVINKYCRIYIIKQLTFDENLDGKLNDTEYRCSECAGSRYLGYSKNWDVKNTPAAVYDYNKWT